MDRPTLDQMFIYGTLIPGESRWHHIEPFVTHVVPATTRGLLFDTGNGYPGARFDGTATTERRIHGHLVTFDRDVLEECLGMIDEIESTEDGLYHRLVVDIDSGPVAWSYQHGRPITGCTPIRSGSWISHTTGKEPESSPPSEADTTRPELATYGTDLLSFIESRIIGSLIEKSLATPQNYPLSINALLSACNQSSSREPVTDLTEADVMDILSVGKERKLVRFVHPRSGHGVTKYRHVLDEFLQIDEGETALLGVLLLRGPQTARELRDRTERLHPFEDTGTVEATLSRLADDGHVVLLDRQPGQRDQRWVQLLSKSTI